MQNPERDCFNPFRLRLCFSFDCLWLMWLWLVVLVSNIGLLLIMVHPKCFVLTLYLLQIIAHVTRFTLDSSKFNPFLRRIGEDVGTANKCYSMPRQKTLHVKHFVPFATFTSSSLLLLSLSSSTLLLLLSSSSSLLSASVSPFFHYPPH